MYDMCMYVPTWLHVADINIILTKKKLVVPTYLRPTMVIVFSIFFATPPAFRRNLGSSPAAPSQRRLWRAIGVGSAPRRGVSGRARGRRRHASPPGDTKAAHRDDEAGCSCAGQTDDTSGPRRCGGDVRRFPSQAVN